MCGTTSGLMNVNWIGSPGRAVNERTVKLRFLPASIVTGRAPGIRPRQRFGTGLCDIATMSARIGWAAIVFDDGR